MFETVKNKKYIRYGEIPPDGKSKIHNSEGEIVGEEAGISVFEYIEGRGLVVPDNEAARNDFSMLSSKFWINHYLVTGDEVGIGSDGEPLIANVKILKTLHEKRQAKNEF